MEDEGEDSEDEPEAQNKAQTIKRRKSVFLDKKERACLTRLSSFFSQSYETVLSAINVQRSTRIHENDYAMWPLEIKIYPQSGEEGEAQIFPLLVRNCPHDIGPVRERLCHEYMTLNSFVF